MKFYRDIRIIFTVLLLVICHAHLSFATPPARPPMWNDPVTAYIVFVAGRFPDENNRFEIEVYCEVRYDIEWLSLEVGHSEEIVFDEELPDFEGPINKGEPKFWRIKGTVNAVSQTDDLGLPAAINLTVEYRFPYKAVLKELEKRNDRDVPYALRELEKVKDETLTIMKALPVEYRKPDLGN